MDDNFPQKLVREIGQQDDIPFADTLNLMRSELNTLIRSNTRIQTSQRDFLEFQSKLDRILNEYEKLFDFSPVGYLIHSREGKIKKANLYAVTHLGFKYTNIIGRDLSDLITTKSDEDNLFTHLVKVCEENKMRQLECEINGDDGILHPMLASSVFIGSQYGTDGYILTVLTDISKPKSQQRQTEESLRKSEQLNEMLSNFISIASHEFRTPLSAVLSSNSLVEKYLQLGKTDMMKKHLLRIKSSVNAMVEIIEDFLSLERLDNGKIHVLIESFDLVSFCNNIIDEITPQIKAGQLVTYSHSGSLQVNSDKKALQRVFFNLLANACKYSPDDGKIEITTHVDSHNCRIQIKDTGIGIPEEQQERIFTRFFRAQNVTSIQGTGLGLYICRGYVELLGGTIKFDSKVNKGTTFVVQIPQGPN